jgi:tungstate transport system substrate-binding protein
MAKKGGIDLVIVHAKKLEEKFVAEGFGTARIPLMYNDFVIVGPEGDPAAIRVMKDVSDAMKAIAEKNVSFISRNDSSGTHVSEMKLWETAGIKPRGGRYIKYAKGADEFIRCLTAPGKGQKIIAGFGKGKFPEPLFYPDSIEYRKANK